MVLENLLSNVRCLTTKLFRQGVDKIPAQTGLQDTPVSTTSESQSSTPVTAGNGNKEIKKESR